MINPQRFSGKSMVVTGAAAGMGKAITLAFLQEGAHVIAVDIDEKALLQLQKDYSHTFQGTSKKETTSKKENNSKIEASDFKGESHPVSGKLFPFAGDISQQETNEKMIDLAVQENGRIDVLVNNAGIAGKSEPITELKNEDWEKVLHVDLYGPMYAIRKAVTQMLKQPQGGSIITIASVAGLYGCRSSVEYTVAKHGLIGLCEHTAYTYMHQGIRSNIICPGAIHTSMSSSTHTAESAFGKERIWSGMDPDVPIGSVEDIAQAVLYLASDEARFLNGTTLVVDGGITCN